MFSTDSHSRQNKTNSRLVCTVNFLVTTVRHGWLYRYVISVKLLAICWPFTQVSILAHVVMLSQEDFFFYEHQVSFSRKRRNYDHQLSTMKFSGSFSRYQKVGWFTQDPTSVVLQVLLCELSG